MQEKCDEKDKAAQAIIDAKLDEDKKVSVFKRLLRYNNPKILICVGLICSALVGSAMPISGVILAELLTYMTSSWQMLAAMAS